MEGQFNDHRRRTQIFKKQIRREQLNQIIHEQRNKLLESQLINLQRENVMSVDIQKLAMNMSALPKESWRYNQFIQLRKGLVPCGDVIQDYDSWFQLDIVKRLVDTFKQENKHLRLAADAAYILADLTYCTKEDGGNTVSKLMAYEFVENLLSLFDDIEATDQQKTSYLFLLSNICRLSSKDRDKIVKLGGGYIIAKFGHKIPTGKLTDAQMIYDYLGSIEGFITIFQVNSVHKLPSNTLLLSLLPIVLYCLNAFSDNIFKRALKLLTRFANTGSLIVMHHLHHQEGLRAKIFKWLVAPTLDIRSLALQILSNLTFSDNSSICEQLVADGILPELHTCYKIKETQSNKHAVVNLLIICSNLVAGGQKLMDTVANSKMLDVLITCAHWSQPVTVQVEAIYCLHSIVRFERYNVVQKLISQYNFIDLLMTSLPNSRAADVNLTIEIIEMINRLIRIYENVYTGNWETGGNKVIKILENIYNFTSGILSEIFNSTKNAILMQRVSLLIDLIAQSK